VAAILKNRGGRDPISEDELVRAKKDYETLSETSARRTLRFWQVRIGSGRYAG
jgi:hypothetical protein